MSWARLAEGESEPMSPGLEVGAQGGEGSGVMD